jgi:O-antigen/teichoic acid export membrane protein
MRPLRSAISKLINNKMAQNTAWMGVAFGGKLLLQALYFVIIARVLGPERFGNLSGLLAYLNILTPFAGWGTGNLIVMYVSRNPEVFRKYWGNALITILISGGLLVIVSLIISNWLFSIQDYLFFTLLFSITHLLIIPSVDAAGHAFQAFEKLNTTAALFLLNGFMKLVAAIGFVLFPFDMSLNTLAIYYLLANLLTSLVSLTLVTRRIGYPEIKLSFLVKHFVEGFYFALGVSSKSIYTDMDKTLLLRLDTAVNTGIYTAAYRIISFTIVPLQAITSAGYARFFRAGTSGIKSTLSLSFRIIPMTGLYGVVVGIILYIVAPFFPIILGPEFNASIDALRWLCVVPFIQSFHYLIAVAVTGAGHQRGRSAIQVTVGVINILLNIWLIPMYSWKGAAIATIASEATLTFCLFIYAFFLARRETQHHPST